MTRFSAIATCLLGIALSAPAAAQLDDLRLPVIIDAERTDYDGKTSMLRFSGLRLTQGNIGIEADVAHASRMDFDNSVWRFSGDVVFDVNEGRVTCDAADLEFTDFKLRRAEIEGSPATFRFTRPGSDVSTYAEAARLTYDVARGIIEFSGGATITEGGNQISSESLVYNIREQRINAVSSADGGDRVTVTYTPPAAPDEAAEPGAIDGTAAPDETPPAGGDAEMRPAPDGAEDDAGPAIGSGEDSGR